MLKFEFGFGLTYSLVFKLPFTQSLIKYSPCFCNLLRTFASKSKLQHVGVLNDLRKGLDYEVGQTFFHRVFAYRGIILHPWKAFVNKKNQNFAPTSTGKSINTSAYVAPSMDTYYQVLVDSRDNSHNLAMCDVSYLKNPGRENFPLDLIPGMDYVSHNDIIPYTSVEHIPIYHKLFDKFIARDRNQLVGTKTLHKWQEFNHLWLEMGNVYIETTDNIRVTAIPFFLGVHIAKPPVYWWRYCIRIENLETQTAKLCEHHWQIISDGTVTRLSGRGVVGKEPVLTSEKPAFQYNSQIYLSTPLGHMWGTYLFEKENGDQFKVCIPTFALENKLDVEFVSN